MNSNHVRHAIAILLVLTLANLAASFAALRAVRVVGLDARAHIERIDGAVQQLTAITTQLCARQPDACSVVTVSTPAAR